MHRILKAKPLFTDLFTSWSGRLSKPTWPAKRSCRPSAPFNRRIYSKSHRVRIQNNNCLQNQYLRVSCNNLLPPKPFQSNEKSKETLLQLFVNILWNELEKNENIAAWSAVFTRAQSLIPVGHPGQLSRLRTPWCKFLVISMQRIRFLICHIFSLSALSFTWAMFSSFARKTSLLRVTLVGIGGVGCCLLWRSQNRNSTVNVVVAKSADHVHAQTRRKTKFDQFASIEVDGQYLMTPADFLESVMHKDLPGDWHMDTHPLPL